MAAQLSADPAAIGWASVDVSRIGNVISDAGHRGAVYCTAIRPAGADEISTAMAALFSAHGARMHTQLAAARDYGQRFADNLRASAGAYAAAESTNAAALGALTGLLALFEADPGLIFFAVPLVLGFVFTLLLPYLAFEFLFHVLAAL